MDLAEEFRNRAHRCLKLAHEAPTLEAQTHWLAMAQLWFSLAEHAEERDAAFFAEATARLPAGAAESDSLADDWDDEEQR